MIYFITYASVLSVLIPIIAYLVIRNRPKYTNTLFFLFIISLSADLTNLAFYKNKGYDVDTINNIYFLCLFLILNRVYFLFWKLLLNVRKSQFNWVSFIFFIVFVLNSIFYEKINEDQSITLTIESIIFVIYAIQFYIGIYKISPPIDMPVFAPFWLNTAIYLYFSFNLFLFAMSNYVFKNMPADVSMVAWGFHNCNNILKNILFGVAVFMERKTTTKLN